MPHEGKWIALETLGQYKKGDEVTLRGTDFASGDKAFAHLADGLVLAVKRPKLSLCVADVGIDDTGDARVLTWGLRLRR